MNVRPVYRASVEKTCPAAAPCGCGRLHGSFNRGVLNIPPTRGVASIRVW